MKHYAEQDIERLIASIEHADEVEILEFDFKPVFAALRRIAELEARILNLDEYNNSAMDMVRDQAVRICELYDDLKTAKADAIEDMITHLKCRFTLTTKSKRIIDYANSLTGEE